MNLNKTEIARRQLGTARGLGLEDLAVAVHTSQVSDVKSRST
jgi:hypothetical protein